MRDQQAGAVEIDHTPTPMAVPRLGIGALLSACIPDTDLPPSIRDINESPPP